MSTHNIDINSLPPIGNTFIELISIDSTNTYAMQQIKTKLAEHGVVYFAYTQTNGRGSRGKAWHSQTGSNIMLSTILNTSWLSVNKQFYLSAAMGLATYDFLKSQVKEGISIKWTNDIYYINKKIGGILIENNIRGNKLQWSIVGIGININQTAFHESIPNPTSLTLITNKKYKILSLAHKLCEHLDIRFKQLMNGNGEEIMKEYNQKLYKQGQKIKLKKNGIVFSCTLNGVTDEGHLAVKNGKEESFDFGEVEWVLD
ncbi:MAG: biotin--[acetyl-CoA-carboxylase] ligase [Chitinophagales bacterium]|nr:biotin--[acetyl-CoA-carboxylase] ligase [Chitinophagales bacterium]